MAASSIKMVNAWTLTAVILIGLVSGGCPKPEKKTPVATGLEVTSDTYAVAGVPMTVTIRAIDSNGKTIPTYKGTIQFSSDDSQAVLPSSFTFTTDNQGTHTFSSGVLLATAGQKTIQVSDGRINGSASVTVTAGPAASFTLALTTTLTTTGEPITIGVTVKDAYENIADNYKGPASFTSTDFEADVPDTYAFTSNDAGVHTFPVYINSPGLHSVCIRDIALNIESCAQVRVYAYTTTHKYIDADSASAGFNIPVTLTSPSTGSPVPGATITASVSNSSAGVTGISEVGSGQYSIGLTMTVATTFLLTSTCSSGCSGAPSVIAIVTVTPGAVVPGNCSAGNPSPATAPVVNVASGVDVSPTVTVTLRDQYSNSVPFQKANIGIVPTSVSGTVYLRKVRDNTDGTYTLWISDGDPNIAQNGTSEEVQLDIQYLGSSFLSVPLTIHFVSAEVTPSGIFYIPTAGTGNTIGVTVRKDGWGFTGATLSYSKTASSGTLTPASGTAQTGGIAQTTVFDGTSEVFTVTARESSTGASDAVEIDVVTLSVLTTTTSAQLNGTAAFVLRAVIKDPVAGHTITAMTNSATTSPANSGGAATLTDAGAGYYILDLSDTVVETVAVTFWFESSAVTTSAIVNFVPGISIQGITPQSSLVPNFGSTRAGGGVSVTVVAQTVPSATGRNVIMTASGGATVLNTPAQDNGDGTYTAYVTSANPGIVTITATDTPSGSTAQVQTEFVRVNLTASPASASVANSIVVTAVIQGSFPTTSRPLTVSPAAGTATVGCPATVPTCEAGGGKYVYQVTDTLAESFTVAVTDTTSGAENNVDVSFTVAVNVAAAPSWSVRVGDTINITSELKGFADASGRAVTISTSSPVIFLSDLTDSGGGISTTSLTSLFPEIVLVTVTDIGTGVSGTLTVEFVGITIEPSSLSLKSGTGGTITVKAGPGGERPISITASAAVFPAFPTPNSSINGTTDSTGSFSTVINMDPIFYPVPQTVTFTAMDLTSGATATTAVEFYP